MAYETKVADPQQMAADLQPGEAYGRHSPIVRPSFVESLFFASARDGSTKPPNFDSAAGVVCLWNVVDGKAEHFCFTLSDNEELVDCFSLDANSFDRGATYCPIGPRQPRDV